MKVRTKLPNQSILFEYFLYKDGCLFWVKTNSNRISPGAEAGKLRVDGYRKVRLFNKEYYTHRLIYKYFFNKDPDYIDHIDGNPNNNNIFNLQEISNGKNVLKQKGLNKLNTSGHRNIYICKNYNNKDITNYHVKMMRHQKGVHLGVFNTIDEAINKRDEFLSKEVYR